MARHCWSVIRASPAIRLRTFSPSVRIESGAKSALDPNVAAAVEPFVSLDVADPGLRVENVTTIEPIRTFWDKVVILHGLRRWFENKGELRQEGQRISRHFYDLHCLLHSLVGPPAIANLALGAECVRHARDVLRPGAI